MEAMKEIKLTQGKVALVDDEDYDRLVAMGKWSFNGAYVVIVKNVTLLNGKKTTRNIYMHKILLNVDGEVDHKDLDKLNNQKYNLRQATRAQNARNQGLTAANKSGYKGVCWFKPQKKWLAKIRTGEKNQKIIGYFNCKIEAAKAYNAAALKYHGEFARLNQIPA